MPITLTEEQRAHLEKLVEYVHADEESDYNDDIANGVNTDEHIWLHVRPLIEFLESTKTAD